MSFLNRLLRRPSASDGASADSRRQFLRRAGGLGLGALGAGVAFSDDAWAAIEERAAHYGIEPGTVVGPDGRPLGRDALCSDPFLGEIMPVPYNFAPRGWAFCNGQLLAISSNSALFSLIGCTFGGDCRTTFALPDLRGRYPLGSGEGPGLSDYALGESGGTEQVTLTVAEMPAHNHTFNVSSTTTPTPPNNVVVARNYNNTADTALNQEISPTGGSQPHNNMPPFLVINYCIALQGVFPSRS